MRDLLHSFESSDVEAIEYFCYRIARELASLSAALGGLDAIVFTGGIGEYAAPVRARVAELTHWLDIRIDQDANAAGRTKLHSSNGAVSVFVIFSNEELMIALHTRRALAEMTS